MASSREILTSADSEARVNFASRPGTSTAELDAYNAGVTTRVGQLTLLLPAGDEGTDGALLYANLGRLIDTANPTIVSSPSAFFNRGVGALNARLRNYRSRVNSDGSIAPEGEVGDITASVGPAIAE